MLAWEMTRRETEAATLQTQTLELEHIEERSRELRRNLRSVGRAVRLMLFLVGLAIVGLGISTVLMPFWPQTLQQYLMMRPIEAHCALGLASLICAVVFSLMGLFYRMELSALHMKSGNFANTSLRPVESRLLAPLTVA